MKAELKKRINQIRQGKIPEGYHRIKDIGIAPIDWPVGKMSDILCNEQRPVPKPQEPYWRLGLRSHAKGTFHELVNNPENVSMEELFEVKTNDLIVNITFAWEHAIALADKEDEGMLVSHRFPTYVFINGNSPEFYKAVVIQKFFKDMLGNISPGGAGRNRVMSKSAFLKLPCYIPPTGEQEKIAEILTHCDKVIKLKKQLIEEKNKQKKWLMQNLLNPESGVRLPGFEGEWDYRILQDIITIGKEKIDPQSTNVSYRCIELEHIESNTGRILDWVNSKEQLSIKTIFRKGDILFGKLRPYLRKVSLALYDGICSSEIWVLKVQPVTINSFMLYSLQSDRFIKAANTTTGTKMPRADWSLLCNYLIALPSIQEQTAIANILLTVDHEINLLEEELAQWQTKKKSLMQLLLTGIIRANV